MRKLGLLLVLVLLVVPAFAASAEFKIGVLPWPGYLQAGSFTLVWSGKYTDLVDAWVGMGYGVWAGHTDWGNPGTWYNGGITLKNLGGLADIGLNWNTDVTDGDMPGTYLVGKPLETYNGTPDSFSGIILKLKAPVKVTVGLRSEMSDAPRLVERAAVRVDGSFAPVTFYGLGYADVQTDNTLTGTTYAVGAKAALPIGVPVTVYGELASTARQFVVGASVTPVTGISVEGRYYGDGIIAGYLTLSNLLPNTSIYGCYQSSGYYYAFVSSTQNLGNIGNLNIWAGVQNDTPNWAFYAKLVTPLPGGATNTLRVFQNYNDDAEAGWFSASNFTIDTTIGVAW